MRNYLKKFKEASGGAHDGYVSKYLNRKLSDPISYLLSKTNLTPNQVSWSAFVIAFLSFISFVTGQNIIGGLLVQFSSIIDGVDGTLAKIKGKASVFGGFLDSILDRYADSLIILGLIIWSTSHEAYSGTWPVGFIAMLGSICISYSRSRIGPEHEHIFCRGLNSLATRDIRLFVMAIGAIIGQAYFTLILIAILTNLVVFYRLIYAYRHIR